MAISQSMRRSKGPASPRKRKEGVTYQHPVAFWVGTAAVTTGVLLHFPDYLASATMEYRMAGMEMSAIMHVGMGLILAGLALAAHGLIPWGGEARPPGPRFNNIHLHAMDSARLSPTHWGLLFVLGVALIVDVMKPATLGFVVPGMRAEYGLTTREIAVFPISALTGTTVGSFLWGYLSDRIGRRASILLASIMFVGTSICGFMPSFGWNLFMCFLMGTAAGGMLPIVYALMAESIPARKRGWLVVLHGGMGTVGGYLAASGIAALLEPHFAWRILWFAGLPSGLLLLVLNRWIPESPRFLLEHGRVDEAERVMVRYGVVLEQRPAPAANPSGIGPPTPGPGPTRKIGLLRLFRKPYVGQTITVVSYGLGWGLVNWGFVTFIPAILEDQGVDVGTASRLLFMSALIAVPGTVLVAYLYGMWSSKKSMILFALVTVIALVGFAVVNPGAAGNERWLTPLMVMLLVGSGGVIAMLSPYTAEVYPTAVRGTGSGLAAGSSKFGGILGPPVAAVILVAAPGFAAVAGAMVVPLLASSGLLLLMGKETKDRPLEELAEAPEPMAAEAASGLP